MTCHHCMVGTTRFAAIVQRVGRHVPVWSGCVGVGVGRCDNECMHMCTSHCPHAARQWHMCRCLAVRCIHQHNVIMLLPAPGRLLQICVRMTPMSHRAHCTQHPAIQTDHLPPYFPYSDSAIFWVCPYPCTSTECSGWLPRLLVQLRPDRGGQDPYHARRAGVTTAAGHCPQGS